MLDLLEVSDARQLSGAGSLSGATIGGVMFGVGMVLARGCASRLLVLSATGNLRALVTGLMLTLVAQSALSGVLAPAREAISELWLISGPSRDLMQGLGLTRSTVLFLALLGLIVSLGLAHTRGRSAHGGAGRGWRRSCRRAGLDPDLRDRAGVLRDRAGLERDLHGPRHGHADGARVAALRAAVLSGSALVPGVFLGAGIAALVAGELQIRRFGPDTPMERYFLGAILMGFGAMLAGGCAVGAAVVGRRGHVPDRMGRGRVDLGGRHGHLGPARPQRGGTTRGCVSFCKPLESP